MFSLSMKTNFFIRKVILSEQVKSIVFKIFDFEPIIGENVDHFLSLSNPNTQSTSVDDMLLETNI